MTSLRYGGKVGTWKGSICNRDGCEGTIIVNPDKEDGQCECHINPPCSYCMLPKLVCEFCDVEI